MLLMKNINKSFFGKPANKNVCLELKAGEIHGLLGENGAGKTTLMNILYGMYKKDDGQVIWKGRPVEFSSPKDAIANHIGMVHQHFMLVPTLTVSQNVTLGLRPKGYPFPNRTALNASVKEISSRYGLELDPEAMVSELSVGEQQRVEIIKLLYRDAELLILDEPTATLTPQETKSFFDVLRRLRESGRSIIIITHRIPEIMEITDRVTVLRGGENAVSADTKDVTEEELAEFMIGRPLKHVRRTVSAPVSEGGLSLEQVSLVEKGRERLRDISMTIGNGEILGVAGVEGNGQKELAEVILGIRRHTSGKILMEGNDIGGLDTLRRRSLGIAYISDDRHNDDLIMDMDLTENMLLRYHCEKSFRNGWGLLNNAALCSAAQKAVEEYDIKAPGLKAPIRYLSGGNQQKFILSREIASALKCVVAINPIRGLDIGAAEFIHERLLELRSQGCSILLVSSDLEEILALSDRIAVLYKGHFMDILKNSNTDMVKLGLLMAGRTVERKDGQHD